MPIPRPCHTSNVRSWEHNEQVMPKLRYAYEKWPSEWRHECRWEQKRRILQLLLRERGILFSRNWHASENARILHRKNEGNGHEWFCGMDFHERHSKTQALARGLSRRTWRSSGQRMERAPTRCLFESSLSFFEFSLSYFVVFGLSLSFFGRGGRRKKLSRTAGKLRVTGMGYEYLRFCPQNWRTCKVKDENVSQYILQCKCEEKMWINDEWGWNMDHSVYLLFVMECICDMKLVLFLQLHWGVSP